MNIRELINLVETNELDEVSVKRFRKQPAADQDVAQAPADNTVPFPNQQAASQPAAPAQKPGPTGDPTLNQPLPAKAAKAPKDPNAPGIATKIGQGVGQLAKGIGAVAGGVAGAGRAIKKGFKAGADVVGGPGAPKATGFGGGAYRSQPAGGGAAGGNVDKELDDLRQMVNKLNARLSRAGIQERTKN